MRTIAVLLLSTLTLWSCKSNDDPEVIPPGSTPTLFADVDLYYTGSIAKFGNAI